MGHTKRLAPVAGLQYAIALILQQPTHQPARDVLVLCDEDDDGGARIADAGSATPAAFCKIPAGGRALRMDRV